MITDDFEFDYYYDNWDEVHTALPAPEGHLHCCIPFLGLGGGISEEINDDSYIESEIDYWNYEKKDILVKKLIMHFPLKEYIKDYVNYIAYLLQIDSLKFNVLQSPREYNFSTDDLVCTISRDEAWDLYQKIDKEKYAEAVSMASTPVPGFLPFYKTEDFYFESKDELPSNNAAILSVLMDVAVQQAMEEDHATFDGAWDNSSYELYLAFCEDSPLSDYYEFDEVLAEDDKASDAEETAKKLEI